MPLARLMLRLGTITLGTAMCGRLWSWLAREPLKVWPLTLLLPPPKCTHCILGKQMCYRIVNTVPKQNHQSMLPSTLPTDMDSRVEHPSPTSMVLPPLNEPPNLPPSSPADPPLCHSTCLRFPYSWTATLDGLHPNPQVATAISADLSSSPSAAAALVTDTDDGNVAAFLAKFVPYCDTH